jgi:hypothetical protein
VRPDTEEAATLIASYNRHLRADGFELHPTGDISGRSVYGARSILQGSPAAKQLRGDGTIDTSYLSRQITRMEAAIASDPELAIGTAKEFVEAVAKTILDQRGIAFRTKDDLPKLVRAALKALDLRREDIPEATRSADTIRLVLSNLATIADGIAALRNTYGTGHGRAGGGGSGLQPRHARLVVGAASTLAVFLLETHESRGGRPSSQ